MIKVTKSIRLLLFVLLFVGCQMPGNNSIPTAYFFEANSTNAYRLSPDGAFVSFIKTKNNVPNIFVRNVATGFKTQITYLKSGYVKAYFWANANTLFYIASTASGEVLCYVNTRGRGNYQTLKANKIAFIDNKIWYNKLILLAIQQNEAGLQHAYKVNISTWKPEIAALNTGYISQWLPDNNGNIKLAVANYGLSQAVLYRPNNKQIFKTIASSDFTHTVSPIKFCKNNSSFYAISNLGRDNTELVTINCSNGQETTFIKNNTNTDVVNVGFNNLLPDWLTVESQKKHYVFLNTNTKKLFNTIAFCLKTPHFEIIDKDTQGNLYVLKTYSDRQKDAFYLYDKAKNKAIKISNNENIKPSDLCEMQPVKFTSTDGAIIYGYLTLPQNYKRNLPCVVIPSPNPNTRNAWGWVPEVQFLANRGYAVLQINYRGCVGYGQAYKTDGFKNWGLLMQNDIVAGAKWLIKQKIANKQKIAIYGFEFGGFAALSVACAKPQVFNCAASYSGINNLFTYLKDNNKYSKPYQQMLYQAIKQSDDDATFMRKMSPVFNTDIINIPLYIVQGGKDKQISVNETNQFVKILRKRNIKIKYLVKDEESHCFSNNQNILELYNNLETFLNQNFN